MPPLSHLTPCTSTKSNLYLVNSLALAVSEPALYRLLTLLIFHYQNSCPFFFAYVVPQYQSRSESFLLNVSRIHFITFDNLADQQISAAYLKYNLFFLNLQIIVLCNSVTRIIILTLWRLNFLLNFSTPCI